MGAALALQQHTSTAANIIPITDTGRVVAIGTPAELLRNAVDHGLPGPEDRLAAGKSAVGTIVMVARHRGTMLAIEVSNDGRGVDPERICRAAVTRQLRRRPWPMNGTRKNLWNSCSCPVFR